MASESFTAILFLCVCFFFQPHFLISIINNRSIIIYPYSLKKKYVFLNIQLPLEYIVSYNKNTHNIIYREPCWPYTTTIIQISPHDVRAIRLFVCVCVCCWFFSPARGKSKTVGITAARVVIFVGDFARAPEKKNRFANYIYSYMK